MHCALREAKKVYSNLMSTIVDAETNDPPCCLQTIDHQQPASFKRAVESPLATSWQADRGSSEGIV